MADYDQLAILSKMLAVTVDTIDQYIQKQEDKGTRNDQYKAVKAKFKERVLGSLTIPQLSQLLKEFGISITLQQTDKANRLVLVVKELKRRKLEDSDVIELYDQVLVNVFQYMVL